ncbi:MAG TPA: 1-acyl-sn-glycerol-3-phosphate acyltransferase [Polyangia bacterium]
MQRRDAPIFHFNQLRPEIVDEVTRRVTDARRDAARERPSESLAYVLNDLVINEQKRLRKIAPPDTLEDKRRVDAVARALGSGAPEDELGRLLAVQVRAYAEDIAGSFSVPAYRVASRILPRVLSFLLTPHDLEHGLVGLGAIAERLRVEGDLAQLRRLSERGVLIVVPTHLSNLDSPLVGFALEQAGLPPMTYGAGKNLFTSPLTSYFMARLGAYKVDRRLRFGLYKEVLKTFSQVILERGLHSIFFPGGTRSRSGAVERKLKLGLAGTALSAYIEQLRWLGPEAARRYYFVPLTLNQPLVLEAETLIEDHLKETGRDRYIIEDDEFTRIGRVVTFARKLLTMDQAIEVRFGAPRDPFGNPVDEEGRSHDRRGREVDPSRYVLAHGVPAHHRARDEEYTRELGTLIADDFLAGSIYFPTHLVALVLFAHLERELPDFDLYQRLRHPRAIDLPLGEVAARVDRVRKAIEKHAERLGRLSERAAVEDGMRVTLDALDAFAGYHTHPAASLAGNQVVLGDRELLLYYRNRLAHHAPALEAAK